MRILLTNDDGIDAPGIRALHRAVRDLGEVHVVAPASVQSAMGHAVTFHRPMRVTPFPPADDAQSNGEGEGGGGYHGHAVEGRPADCVKLAVTRLMPGPPDVVISGMNAGCNIGINVNYSGTVAAARESAFLGIPSLAVSLHIGDPGRTRWDDAADHARRALDAALAGPLRPHTLININVPILDDGREPRGLRVVRTCTSAMDYDYDRSPHDDGTCSYYRRDGLNFRDRRADTDVDALFAGYITLTPLHFDATDYDHLEAWAEHAATSDPAESSR